jgi:iron complex transport system substrate-binding protein
VALKSTLAGVLAGLTLFAAACGSDDDASTTTGDAAPTEATTAGTSGGAATTADTAATTPVTDGTTVGSGGTTVGSEPGGEVPERIVSLSATHTETLFAIGAGDQVIAVDDQSNYPAEAAAVMTDLSGYTPNVEAIAEYDPDLVVTSGDDELTAQLEAVGIPVWVGPSAATFDEAYAQIEQLGAATGHVGEAAELVGQMQTDLETMAADLPTSETPLSVFHELSSDGYSASTGTFIGQVYALFGLENIADAADDGTGYPQLNAETIIAADPDLIFLADTKCCGESLETVAARPGWADMAAVVDGNVFAMDDDVASRWGPRVVEYAQQVHDAVQQALVPAG